MVFHRFSGQRRFNEDQQEHAPVTLQVLLKWILQGMNDGTIIFAAMTLKRLGRRLSKIKSYEKKSNRQLQSK